MSFEDPNFTIITPGGCNAHCEFCTDSYNRKPSPNYMENLEDAIFNKLPAQFDQVSISGGEPTISKQLGNILGLITLSKKFKRVVLTTNGAKLIEKLPIIVAGVTHLNISRHGIGYEHNTAVFKTNGIATDEDIARSTEFLNKRGIFVNFNYVYDDKNLLTKADVMLYIQYAKSLGINSVCFRYDQNQNNLNETYLEKMFNDYVVTGRGECPVCRSHTILIRGMPVTFKASIAEPSIAIDNVYELIYGINGKLTTDWAGNVEFTEDVRKKYKLAFAGDTEDLTKSSLDAATTVVAAPLPNMVVARPLKRRSLADITPNREYGGGCGGTGGGCGKSDFTPTVSNKKEDIYHVSIKENHHWNHFRPY